MAIHLLTRGFVRLIRHVNLKSLSFVAILLGTCVPALAEPDPWDVFTWKHPYAGYLWHDTNWSNVGNDQGILRRPDYSGAVAIIDSVEAMYLNGEPVDGAFEGSLTLGELLYRSPASYPWRNVLTSEYSVTFSATSGNARYETGTQSMMDIEISGIILQSTTEFNINYTGGGTFTSKISGPGELIKSGPATLSIVAANSSYQGNTIIWGGTLEGLVISNAGVDSSFGHGNFEMSNAAQLRYAGASAATNRTVKLSSGGGDISVKNTGTLLTWSGVISGTGTLRKSGQGALELNGLNTYSGATEILEGTLRLGNHERIPNDSAVMVAGNTFEVATFDLNDKMETIGSLEGAGMVKLNGGQLRAGGNGLSTTFSGEIRDAGSFTKLGAGTMTLSSINNSYTGNTQVTGGVLSGSRIRNSGVNSSFGQGNFAISNGATLQYTGVTTSTDRTIELSNGGGGIEVTEANSLLTVSGVISGASASNQLTKSGAGTLVLSAANTYIGGTSINGGALYANNTSGSATGTGKVTVNSGGKLGGTGAIAGAVAVNAGGVLAPGTSIESLAIGDLTLNSPTSTLQAEINLGSTLAADLLSVTGAISLADATLDVLLLDTPSAQLLPLTFLLVANDDASPLADAVTGEFATVRVSDGFRAQVSYSFSGIDALGRVGTGNDIAVTITAVPEPNSLLLTLSAASALFLLSHNKRISTRHRSTAK